MRLYSTFLLAFSFLVVGCTDKLSSSEDPLPENLNPNTLSCIDGMADDTYSCNNISMLARVPVKELLGERLNDIWGWTDPQTGTEYVLVGLTDGVTFVDISNPAVPEVLGKLEETASASNPKTKAFGGHSLQHDDNEGKSSWRDFKVYQNYLFVVSDAQPHGLQVFDLTRLRGIENPPQIFSENKLYQGFENAHNIAINEETGFAYVVGSNTYGGGLHILDIKDPMNPQFAGFHSDSSVGRHSTGYVHDTHCVSYQGPDTDYQGDEICLNSSETHLLIANASDKEAVRTIAAAEYQGNSYAHQGWLTEDHRYFLLDDELDELNFDSKTRTFIWDVQDLDNPKVIGIHESTLGSTDHNQYVKGDYVYQANYTAGLQILSLNNIANGELSQVAHFDTFPADDDPKFEGAWSNYPYFGSGVIVVSDMSNGLFILQPNLE